MKIDRSAPRPDAVVAVLAGRQHGVVSRAQLLEAGITDSSIRRRVERGVLRRVHTGVFVLGAAPLTYEGRCVAALLAAGPGCAVSHLTAARLWRISRFPRSQIDVLSPTSRRARDGVAIHRTRHLPATHVCVRHGIRRTSVARTVVDLAAQLTPWQLANVVNQAVFRRRLRVETVSAVAARLHARRSHATLTRAMELHGQGSAGTKSAAEDAYLGLVLAAGVPEPLVNVMVEVGANEYELDFHWPAIRVNVEIDGSDHANPSRAIKDRLRDQNLRAAGWRVLRLDPAYVEDFPDRALRATREALAGN